MNEKGSTLRTKSQGSVISLLLPILFLLSCPAVLISQVDAGQNEHSQNADTLTICGYQTAPDGRIEDVRLEDLKRIIALLNTKFENTRMYTVLDRRELKQVFEQKLVNEQIGGVDTEKALARLLELDLLLEGKLTHFYQEREKTESAYLDEPQIKWDGHAAGVFKMINVESGSVAHSTEVEVEKQFDSDSNPTKRKSELMKAFATKSVGSLLKEMTEVRVLKKQTGGHIYFNRGASAGVEDGIVYEVMRVGEEMIDPDTGKSLGRKEKRVGEVRVIDVQQARSKAKIISGTAEQGDLLRNPRKSSGEENPDGTDGEKSNDSNTVDPF